MIETMPVSDVLRQVSAVIAALPAEPYQQGPGAAEFTEVRSLDMTRQASSVMHLRYYAGADNATSTNTHRGGRYGSDAVSTRLLVTLAYRLRPGEHPGDIRLGWDAAQDVTRAINRAACDLWSTEFRSIGVTIDVEMGVAIYSIAYDVLHVIGV